MGRSLLMANPVYASTDAAPAGVNYCPADETLVYSANYSAGTGYCIKTPSCAAGYVFKRNPRIAPEGGTCVVAPALRDPLSSSTTPSTTPKVKPAKVLLDIACMKTTINKRDGDIIIALGVYNTSIIASLNKRLAALMEAWSIADRSARKAAIKKVWSDFKSETKIAGKTLNQAKLKSWLTFTTERKACGAYAISDDYTSRSVDSNL
jgi:hypothetical protein